MSQVLHLLAMARAADIDLTIDDFQTVADRTPYLADLKPSGRYCMEDLHRVGGIPALLKYLLAHTDVIDGTQLTVTGRSLAENVADAAELFPAGPDTAATAQDVVRPLANPIKRTGHIAILRGNLAPGSAVAKITGAEGVRFDGTVRCFDDENSIYPALAAGEIKGLGWFSFLGTRAPKVPPVCQRYDTVNSPPSPLSSLCLLCAHC
jgi:dihydroxy-acid dehydratase